MMPNSIQMSLRLITACSVLALFLRHFIHGLRAPPLPTPSIRQERSVPSDLIRMLKGLQSRNANKKPCNLLWPQGSSHQCRCHVNPTAHLPHPRSGRRRDGFHDRLSVCWIVLSVPKSFSGSYALIGTPCLPGSGHSQYTPGIALVKNFFANSVGPQRAIGGNADSSSTGRRHSGRQGRTERGPARIRHVLN
jgi:hypothetical protein